MRKRIGSGLVSCGVLFVITGAAHAQTDAGLEKLANEYWDATMQQFPTWATALGDYRYNDQLEDRSEASRQEWQKKLTGLMSSVRRYHVAKLSPADRLTHRLLERAIEDALLRTRTYDQFTPLDPLNGAHIQLPLLLVSQPFRNVKDFRDYIARLRAFPKQAGDAIASMQSGLDIGIVAPTVLIRKAVPQLKAHIVSDAVQSVFYEPAEQVGTLREAERTTILEELKEAITSDVIPSYLRLLAYVEDEYAPRCRETVGLGALPNGLRMYEALVKMNTSNEFSSDSINEVGVREVARIRKEMEKVKSEIGFEGTLDQFLTHMRTDPSQRFRTREEILATSSTILERTKKRLPELFKRLPKADCVMKEIETFRAASSPVAYYNAPPDDGSRPGYYYTNTLTPTERLRFTVEALTYHEALPGHHLQIALHGEDHSLPRFRRFSYYNAYGEGWALYAEKLGYELGGYKDAHQRFGQLTFEMWRACRLVVDTGLHARSWSRRRAIDYLAANTSLAPSDIETEVDRYITWPSQAVSYKIGEMKILALRSKAEQRLGKRFDLRAFHDALLSDGSMPLDVLEEHMHDWIASQQE